MIGIYCIKDIVNDRKYVGSSKNIKLRWSKHQSDLRKGKHRNSYLQRAWNKYGSNNFEFDVLIECEESKLEELEFYWIKFLKSDDREYGYNLQCKCGRIVEWSEEIRNKKSKAAIEQWQNKKPEMIKGLKLAWEQPSEIRLEALKKSGLSRRDNRLVNEYSVEGEFISSYSSRREAYLANNKNRNVYRVLDGKLQSTKGKIFKYN